MKKVVVSAERRFPAVVSAERRLPAGRYAGILPAALARNHAGWKPA